MAREKGKAEAIDFDEDSVYDRLQEMTRGRGPDRCIDPVGCEPTPPAASTRSWTR
jgi:NADPH:quinone reductase-like Zn-dependent oxidoreductase